MNFSDKLKELRLKNNETQQELASKLNISFQSISKWEKGLNLPSIDLMKELAKHYDVSLDYLLDNEIEEVKKEYKEHFVEYHPVVNKASSFSIFLEKDKLYTSRLVKDRYRTDAEHNHRASDDINSYVIAVDSNGKIIYMALGTGHGKGSPCDPFYHRKDIIEAKNLDCFHLLDSYRPFRDGLNPLGYMDFEFIIPKEGFVITISNNAFEKRTLLSFLLKGNNLLNGGMHELINGHIDSHYLFKPGDLDDFTLSFNDGVLRISYTENEEDVIKDRLDNKVLNEMFKKFIKLNKKEIINMIKEEILESLDDRFSELEDQINEAMEYAEEAKCIAEDALAEVEEK